MPFDVIHSVKDILSMSDTDHNQGDTYSEAETVARREAALKRMLATPPKPQKSIRPAVPRSDRKEAGEAGQGPRQS